MNLGEVCQYDSGIWGDEPDGSENCYPVLRSNNIKDGKMLFDDIATRKVNLKYVGSKLLRNGDILVTTSSGSRDLLGKSAIFISPNNRVYLFSNFTMRLRINENLADYLYVFLYLQSPEAKGVLRLLQDTTTGLRNLDRKEFMNQLIPLPPLSEQKRIA
ncbi:MAG: restriction endonuclease subunit S, partial [Caldisericaceae bacterium]